MKWPRHNSKRFPAGTVEPTKECAVIRSGFSAYLDGAVSGVEMAAISGHLQQCNECAKDFQVWREVQQSLGELGPQQPPARFQARLRGSIAPLVLRLSGGFAVTVMLAGALSWMFGAPIAVQANDDAMAHLVAPHYMYSQVPPVPINTRRDMPIVVDAMVDSSGRVYGYTILEGPKDAEVNVRIENNLLSSVFRPATVFGVPVRGHVVMTYTGVSVRG
jgi:hypothetical protein